MQKQDQSIKEFYTSKFPEDEAGQDIADISFLELFYIMDAYKDVYPYLAGDSLVRERVFVKLAEIMEVDYDYVYEQWLKGGK